MLFAWYGFRLRHPEDWAPVTITGNREEGYVRLASAETISGQIRWKSTKSSADLQSILDSYFAKLTQEAKRQKVSLSTSSDRTEDRIDYKWSGRGRGHGSVLFSPDCGRAFIVEASATNNRSVQGAHKALMTEFVSSEPEELETWALFGLEIRLPSGLQVMKQIFQSGRTRLEFRGKQGSIVAERWGFGEQIAARHTFQQWTMNAMAIPKAKLTEEPEGLSLVGGTLLAPTYGLAQLQRERNQIVTVRVTSRKWRPTWDWLI